MFFSCAVGGDPGRSAEGAAVAAAEPVRGQPRRHHVNRGAHAVSLEHRPQGLGRRDQRLHGGALRAREAARQEAAQRPGQHRRVVVQVLLEEGVIGRDAWDAGAPRAAHARIVRDERCLDVHEIECAIGQRVECVRQCAPRHAPVLGVAWHRRGRHAQHGILGGPGGVRGHVTRCHQQCIDRAAREILPKGADGGRDAVDARKVDVGNEQHAHVLMLRAKPRAVPLASHITRRRGRAARAPRR